MVRNSLCVSYSFLPLQYLSVELAETSLKQVKPNVPLNTLFSPTDIFFSDSKIFSSRKQHPDVYVDEAYLGMDLFQIARVPHCSLDQTLSGASLTMSPVCLVILQSPSPPPPPLPQPHHTISPCNEGWGWDGG